MPRRIATVLALFALVLAATAGAAEARPNGPIVFAGGNGTQGSGLWAWKAGWRGLRHLTTNPTDADPQASRDGRWIVFTRRVDTPNPTGPTSVNVFRVRSDGSRVVRVTRGPYYDRAPSFSPSGNRVLFSRAEPEPGAEFTAEHVFGVRLDGSGSQQLTSGGFSDRNPVFSPNGRVIAFERVGLGQGGHVHTMRPDGSGLRDATPRLAAWSSEPAFSPDGRRIVYVRGFPGSSPSDLFTMRPNGTGVSRLTGRAGNPLGGVLSPSWSPDGTRIAFQLDPGAKFSKLRVIRVRGRSLGASLGGPRFAQSPDMRTPTWLPLEARG